MSFELGNSFYQDCSTFENSIYPTNLKPLTYLAKISSAPFSISKGPDITSLTVAANATTLTVRAAASDSAFSYKKVATSKQTIREIRAFVNTHPYAMLSNGFRLTKGRVSIDVSSLASGSRNVVCVQATDSAGYRGPVTATYFIK
jgi:carboxypeptidase T